MEENFFASGREVPFIDPSLNVWHWHIPLYLFLGGLAAGILFFSSLFYLLGKEENMKATVKWSTFLVPVSLALGLLFLFLDLKHKMYFWKLYTTIRLESPMSWGAWILLVITPLSILWSASFVKELFPRWSWKLKILDRVEAFVIQNRKLLAAVNIVLAVVLGIYTGILLSAFNARPLWNSSILGPLFLTSGLSTGVATILLMAKSHAEKKALVKIDMLLIAIELFLIIHLFMGYLASSQVQIEAAQLFLGGPFTFVFWGGVVVLGLIVPFILEGLELMGYKIHVAVSAILILIGGLVFRFIMVEAGQISHFIF